MGPLVSTVKISSVFQTLVSVHSSCSLTRTAIRRSRLGPHLRAPPSTQLCNRVPHGSRRKLRLPKCEFISYFMCLFAQRQLLCSVGKPLALTAFGIVTQNNLADFVPFNDSTPVTSTLVGKKRKALSPLILFQLAQHGAIPLFSQARVKRQLAQAFLINSANLRTHSGCKVCDRRN